MTLARTAPSACLLLSLAALVAGCATTRDGGPGRNDGFAFAVLGDAPYNLLEERRFERVLEELDAADLQVVVHVGDMLWRPCTDEKYERRLAQFEGLRHPVVYTPGDNEWFDCHERGYAPLERLERLRTLFFAEPTQSLGGREIELSSQGETKKYAEFVENRRWTLGGVTFATVHVIGSGNGWQPFARRTAEDDAAAARRAEAAAAWTRETFGQARRARARAVVLAFQGAFDGEDAAAQARAYEPFLSALVEEAGRFKGPVLLAHGDGHRFTVDRPLRGRDGRTLANVTRLEVPGHPRVGWVKVVIPEGRNPQFAFESSVVPFWKLW